MELIKRLLGTSSTSKGITDEPRNMAAAPDKWKIVDDAVMKKHYKRYPHSFADKLSVSEYIDETKTFELHDAFSHAVVLTCTSIPTEGRSSEQLEELRDTIVSAWRKAFALPAVTPWIMQTYSYKETGLYRYVDDIESFIAPEIRKTEFTQEYLSTMNKHFKGISKSGGIFVDNQVTSAPFRGQVKRCKIIIYRNCEKSERTDDTSPAEELNELVQRFESQLSSTGIKITRDDGNIFQQWLTDWFNPKPSLTDGNKGQLLDLTRYPDEASKPFGYNIADNVVHGQPISDPDKKCWYFDGVPHQYIRVTGLMNQPKPGQITGEISSGVGKASRASAMIDALPDGAMWHQTIIMMSEKQIDAHISGLKGVGKSETRDAAAAENAIESLHNARNYGMTVHKSSMGVFIRANPELDPEQYHQNLKSTVQKVSSLMMSNNLTPAALAHDELQIESYIPHLPMNYTLSDDPFSVYMGLYYDIDLVNLLPLWGREQGTGNPGMVNFNRGGEPQCFDMFGLDKVRSSHGALIGPQGSGKSAQLCTIAAALMAVHRPRLTILEKGGSFRVLGDYFERYGLKVQRIKLGSKRSQVFFCPYLDSHLLFEDRYQSNNEDEGEFIETDPLEDEEGDEAQREPMAEMLQATVIMITGGNPDEYKKITQIHKALLEKAITNAAEKSFQDREQTITSDVCRELGLVIKDAEISDTVRAEMMNYLVALEGWTTGPKGQMFNKRGKTFDESADVTIIDIGKYDGETFSAELSVIYVALSTHLFNMGEKHQGSGRDDVFFQDETHVFTDKPLLAPYMATAVKLMRKLGLKALYATQNVSDFKNGAEKILKIIEWWVLLNLEESEIEEVSQYRSLTPAQRDMLLSCTKQKRCYTEGVVMGNRKVVGEMLVRFVPPSKYLAFAMTDTDEKTERTKLKEQFNFKKDIDSALYIAHQLDVNRGIVEDDVDMVAQIIAEQAALVGAVSEQPPQIREVA